MEKSRLDQFVVDIEFLLISVVQGVALAELASSSVDPISNLQFASWGYIISGFLFILIFWSGAIIHSLSFIDWPLDLYHNFLYFLLAYVEVLSFGKITSPLQWFGLMTAFFIVGEILYMYDLSLIKRHQKNFLQNEKRKKLYQHIYKEQIFELTAIVPFGIIYNLLSFIIIWKNQNLFLHQGFHIYLILPEVIFIGFFLFTAVKSFRRRARLISPNTE